MRESFEMMRKASVEWQSAIDRGIDRITEILFDSDEPEQTQVRLDPRNGLTFDQILTKDRIIIDDPISRNTADDATILKWDAVVKNRLAQADPLDKPEDRIVAACLAIDQATKDFPDRVARGAHVLHYKGGEYTVRGAGIIEATITPAICYHGTKIVVMPDGTQMIPMWIRPIDDFLADIELPDGQVIPRFRSSQRPQDVATEYPRTIAPKESRRDYQVTTEPPPGATITEGTDPIPGESETPERVMSIASGLVLWQGLKVDEAQAFVDAHIWPAGKAWFPDRVDAETDENHKQIIPYVMIRCGHRFAVFKRKGKTETRYNGKICLGVGGHVNQDDMATVANGKTIPLDNYQMIVKCVRRELNEEVPELPRECQLRFTGLMNWDGEEDNGLGKYHLGIVYQITISHPVHFEMVNSGMEFLGWWEGSSIHKHLADNPDGFEMWAKILTESEIIPSSYAVQ